MKKERVRNVTVVIFVAAILIFQVYSGVFPPVTIVTSESMQHSASWKPLVLNTGDIAIIKKVSGIGGIETYVLGRSSGFQSFGDYGNVIVYRAPDGISIIHRAMFYLQWVDGNPVVLGYDNQSWLVVTHSYVIIKNVGYSHRNLLVYIEQYRNESGFVTCGDYNLANLNVSYNESVEAYAAADQDGIFGFQDPPVKISNIVGKVIGEIPWFGLIKLTILWKLGLQKQENQVPHGAYMYLITTISAGITVIFFPYRRLWMHFRGKR